MPTYQRRDLRLERMGVCLKPHSQGQWWDLMSRGQALDRVPFSQGGILEDAAPLPGPRHLLSQFSALSWPVFGGGRHWRHRGNRVQAHPTGSLCSSDVGVHHRGCQPCSPAHSGLARC